MEKTDFKDFTFHDHNEDVFERALSPFEEFLPDMRPGNSELYLTLLASAMKEQELTEEQAVKTIIERSPFVLDEAALRELVRGVYAGERQPDEKLAKKARIAVAQQAFMRRRYVFRFNTVLGVIEYCERGRRYHYHYRPVDDRVINSITLNAHEEGIDMWDRDVKRYLSSDRVMTGNPFDDFIAGLPKWDHKPRIDKLLARVPVDDPQWYALAHTWLLGMVAQWMGVNPKKGNESMLILVGEQGIGKSTFCRNLLPRDLAPYYTENFSLTNQRKALLMLTRYGLINFDEMNRLTERQQPILKNMLQLPTVDETRPWASTSKQERRYASLMGTSNNTDIIIDLTGSRRYICGLVTGKIDTKSKINYPQLYAEALYEIQQGRRYWLDEADEKALTERNARFTALPSNAEQFAVFYDPGTENDPDSRWMYAAEIHKSLHPTINAPMTNKECRDFRALMQSLGVQSKRARIGIKYLVRPKGNAV